MEVWIPACAESLLSYYRIIAVLCIQIITMKIGAIFDWDGVIIDSSRYHEKSWEKLAQQENKALPHNYLISLLPPEVQKKLVFGIRRYSSQGEMFVSNTFSRVMDLVDLNKPENAKFVDISTSA